MRLILHAGTHKTGTTSIQRVLADNRRFLRRHGLVYPGGGIPFRRNTVSHHRFAHGLVDPDAPAFERGLRFLDRATRSAKPDDTLIISAEPMYRHVSAGDGDYWDRRRRYLRTLADCLSGFDVEVVLFFRDKEDFARSLYNEMLSKGRKAKSFDEFKARRPERFDYDGQVAAFREAFSTVRAFSYEEAREHGLISYFFDVIGFPVPPGADDVWARQSTGRDYSGQPVSTSNASRSSTVSAAATALSNSSRLARASARYVRPTARRSWRSESGS